MARPTFTDIASTDIDGSSVLSAAVMEDLRDNINAMRVVLIGFSKAETTTTNTSFTDVERVYVPVPDIEDYTGIVRKLVARFEGYVSGGTGTYRLYDETASVYSSETTTVTTADYEALELTLTGTAGWAGVTRSVMLQQKISTTAETVRARSGVVDGFTWSVDY